jgi:energy-coupling factor transport system permease protein
MTVSLYLNHKTWVHRLDGRTKILVVLGFFVLALCFSHPGYLLVVLAMVAWGLAMAQAGVNVKKIGVLAALLVCYSIMLWPFFVDGETPIPGLQFLGVTWEGCLFGLGMGIRLLIMVWGGIWLLSTTTIEEVTQASQRLGLPLRFGFAFSLAFRWVGILLGAGVGVIQAQRARGLDISSGSMVERIRKYVPLVVPLIGHALRQTNLLAMALESKGFHPTAHRTFYFSGTMKKADYAVLIFLSVLLGVTVWLKWEGIGILDVRF